MTSVARIASTHQKRPPGVWMVAAAALMAGCSGGGDKPASQVAAKVNDEEISVHQVNFVLQRQQGIRPEQAEAATRQVLERLVDQELAVQKAQEMKLERDPNVLMAIEASRREVLARAYADRIAQAAAQPTSQEVEAYYTKNPALFKERRVYQLQELLVEVPPERVDSVTAALRAARTGAAMVEWLRKNDVRFAGNQAVRAAEQLPLGELDGLADLKDGESLIKRTSQGLQVIVLAGSRAEPVDLARATPAIEQFLINDRKRDVVEKQRATLREAAKIEYVGRFAAADAAVPAAAAASAVPAVPVSGSASAIGADALSKGLKGLK